MQHTFLRRTAIQYMDFISYKTALLKKYNKLEDLTDDVKNGKVNFKKFRDNDGMAL
jgi:hypothetical protein